MPTFENSDNPKQFQKNPDTLGACWKKRNDQNIEYLSIKIEINGETLNLKGFLNGAKAEGDLRPDFIIYKSKNINKQKELNGNK